MTIQRLYSFIRKGLDDYHMIAPGDKIAIGISGGKDSLALLHGLAGLRRFYPVPFELVAISVSLGFEGMDFSPIETLCQELSVPYYIVNTDISTIIFDDRKESNPCSLCAKMRKGALNEKAKELGCNKVAYGHHKDDIIETFFMSMIYEGRIHSFSPITYLDRMDLTVIRPMLYLTESDVIGFQNKYALPVVKNKCPADGNTKREYIKNLIASINHETPGVKNRIFTAMVTQNISGWGGKRDA
ncbi:tRNA(Ile)-lysidine synthase TilS/MesJ [Lachnospiraceae bacterium XBB1006]|nr:tRNA(Ile)-lysidine synthase TilS/MesJ [Lachnospiraceae bacterium XBB1006]